MSQTDLDTDIGTRFLGALATRDYAALGACSRPSVAAIELLYRLGVSPVRLARLYRQVS